MTFGERLKELRTKRGWTQEQTSAVIGISRSFYGMLETDGKQEISIEKLRKIAQVFNVSTDYLICIGEQEETDTFASRLRKLRIENKMSQTHLSEKMGLHNSTLTKYESGEREPDFSTLVQICIIFNVSSDYLLGLKEEKE